MKIITIIINVALIIFIVGCTSIPQKQNNSESSVIAIDIGGTADEERVAWGMIESVKVFFVRLDNDDKLISNDIIEWSGGEDKPRPFGERTIYLFNVKPGRYAAVAVYGSIFTAAAAHETGSIGTVYTKYGTKGNFIIFSEQLIKSTIVNVEPGTFVFMGGFLIDSISYNETSDECDDIQKYYYNYFSAIDNSNPFSFLFRKKIYLSGSLKKEFTSTENKIAFLLHSLEKFKGTPWRKNIERTILKLSPQLKIEEGTQDETNIK